MKLGIIQLPYEKDVLFPIINQVSGLNCDFYLYDRKEKFTIFLEELNPSNIHYIDMDPYDVKGITEHVRENEILTVVSFAEFGLPIAAQVRESLGLKGHDLETELITINKYAMRQRLMDLELTKCRSTLCETNNLIEELVKFGFPAIVKPVNLVGSICVELVNNVEQSESYLTRLRAHPIANGVKELLIEDYIEGPEYCAEGVLLGGKTHLYGVTEKRITGAPYFVASGHSFFIQHELRSKLDQFLPTLFKALNMDTCPFHIEFKYIDGNFEVIEVHSRFPNDSITDLIELVSRREIFNDYFEYLLFEKHPSLDLSVTNISSIEFIIAEIGKINQHICSDELRKDRRILQIKEYFPAGANIELSTGYFELAAHIMYRASNAEENKAILDMIHTGYSIEQ